MGWLILMTMFVRVMKLKTCKYFLFLFDNLIVLEYYNTMRGVIWGKTLLKIINIQFIKILKN